MLVDRFEICAEETLGQNKCRQVSHGFSIHRILSLFNQDADQIDDANKSVVREKGTWVLGR